MVDHQIRKMLFTWIHPRTAILIQIKTKKYFRRECTRETVPFISELFFAEDAFFKRFEVSFYFGLLNSIDTLWYSSVLVSLSNHSLNCSIFIYSLSQQSLTKAVNKLTRLSWVDPIILLSAWSHSKRIQFLSSLTTHR